MPRMGKIRISTSSDALKIKESTKRNAFIIGFLLGLKICREVEARGLEPL